MTTIALDPDFQVSFDSLSGESTPAKRCCTCSSFFTVLFSPLRFGISLIYRNFPTINICRRKIPTYSITPPTVYDLARKIRFQQAITEENIPKVISHLRDPSFHMTKEEATQAFRDLIPIHLFGAEYELTDLLSERSGAEGSGFIEIAFDQMNRQLLLGLLEDPTAIVPGSVVTKCKRIQNQERELVLLLAQRGAEATICLDVVIKHYIHALRANDHAFLAAFRGSDLERAIWETPAMEPYLMQAIKDENNALLSDFCRVKPRRELHTNPLTASFLFGRPRAAAALLKAGFRIEEMTIPAPSARAALFQDNPLASKWRERSHLLRALENEIKRSKSFGERLLYNKVVAFLNKNPKIAQAENFLISIAILLNQERLIRALKLDREGWLKDHAPILECLVDNGQDAGKLFESALDERATDFIKDIEQRYQEGLDGPANRIVLNARMFFDAAIEANDKELIDAYSQFYFPSIKGDASPLDTAFFTKNYYAMEKLLQLDVYPMNPSYFTPELLLNAARKGSLIAFDLCLNHVSIKGRVGSSTVLEILCREKRHDAMERVIAHPQFKLWCKGKPPLEFLKNEYGYKGR